MVLECMVKFLVGFAAFIMVSLKTVLNYLIGIWLMNKVKELEQE